MPSAPFDHPLPGLHPAWQVAAAVALGAAGLACLLPRPRGRRVAVGVLLTLMAGVVFGVFAATTFAGPTDRTVHDRVYAGLFWLFASVAVSFAVVMVAQKNPARGAMAFAVSVLATCGLFLLLAAPFLMAATVTVYAGAIIVTFLFVLMLSHAGGPSDENDRTREPLLGSLGGLGFAGLVLFTLYLGGPGRADPGYPLPAAPVTDAERDTLKRVTARLREAADVDDPGRTAALAQPALAELGVILGSAAASAVEPPVQARLRFAAGDPRTAGIVAQADALQVQTRAAADALAAGVTPDGRAKLRAAADGADLLRGRGELPARNVSAVGFSLYSEHLLAVELAGALLLVATVGAVVVAGRRPTA